MQRKTILHQTFEVGISLKGVGALFEIASGVLLWVVKPSQMNDIVRWCSEGKLSAHVHAVYPLAEIATALKAIADRKVMGKIVLRP